jgi:hypothetical protein
MYVFVQEENGLRDAAVCLQRPNWFLLLNMCTVLFNSPSPLSVAVKTVLAPAVLWA